MVKFLIRLFSFKILFLRREVASLRAQLHAEKSRIAELERHLRDTSNRNRLREDILLSRAIEAAGLKPVTAQHLADPAPADAVKAKPVLTQAQEEDREMWADMAEESGFSRHKGAADWDARFLN